MSEFKPDRRQGGILSQVSDQAGSLSIVAIHDRRLFSLATIVADRGKGKSTPASTVNATQGASSTRASNTKKRRVDYHSDANIDTPLTRKDIPSIVKAVIDTMPGTSTHQLPDDVDNSRVTW